MANDWFRFKKFIVHQELSAMKVSTDACIFGAWVTRILPKDVVHILDVGAGTGLLSLMLLQEHPAVRLTGLEPEPAAASEAAFNISRTGWGGRMELVEDSLQSFSSENDGANFDFIICNPPFFQNHLLASKAGRNMARHDSLPPETLANASRILTHQQGYLAVMYPENIWESWMVAALKEGWYPEKVLYIQPVTGKPPNRVCGLFSKKETTNIAREPLLIREATGIYTSEFKKLLSPFYLKLSMC